MVGTVTLELPGSRVEWSSGDKKTKAGKKDDEKKSKAKGKKKGKK